jgi:hypothetical protein
VHAPAIIISLSLFSLSSFLLNLQERVILGLRNFHKFTNIIRIPFPLWSRVSCFYLKCPKHFLQIVLSFNMVKQKEIQSYRVFKCILLFPHSTSVISPNLKKIRSRISFYKFCICKLHIKCFLKSYSSDLTDSVYLYY